jgi:ArsR family transcriptional regulator, arsenate/arsenite/antimonite-responsive transcriptional repressor
MPAGKGKAESEAAAKKENHVGSNGISPNTLNFHFDRLRDAGLVTVRGDGRSMIYAAQYETMNDLLAYLTENCCQGAQCAPEATCKPARTKRAKVTA